VTSTAGNWRGMVTSPAGYRRSAYPGHGRAVRSAKLASVKTNIKAGDASPPALACPRAMRHGCYAVQATESSATY
jgi:hypothetical protein